MTPASQDISDTDLLAYVDGALSAEAAQRIARWLDSHPEQKARVESWRRQNASIASLYEPVTAEPVPPRLDVRHMHAVHKRAGPGWRPVAAAAVLCLIVASGAWSLGYRAASRTAYSHDSPVAEAFAAHRLYASEMLHPVQVAGNRRGELSQWLSDRLDYRLVIPDLSAMGWHLLGGSLVPVGSKPGALLMYENAQGRRVTLSLTVAPRPGDTEPRYARSDALASLTWQDGRLDCTVVGPIDHKALHRIATAVYRQLA